MRKTISLIMATYNGARFLREQLDSIYNQTLLPDEVIVCDDRSTDGTVDILKEYSQTRGLHYYVNEKSLGVNGNFYKAMSLATCDYIAICDQDDIWLPEKIETTYKKLCDIDDGKPCVVSSLCNHIDAEGNITSNLPDKPDTSGYAATLLSMNSSQGCSLMLNRSLLKMVFDYNKLSQSETIIYDAFINYTAAIFGQKYNLGRRLMLYRHHDKNVIAKAQLSKRSYGARLRNQPLIKGLLPIGTLKVYPALLEIYSGRINNKHILEILNGVKKISQSNNFYNKIKFVCTMDEIRLGKKTKIIVRQTIVSLLQTLFI